MEIGAHSVDSALFVVDEIKTDYNTIFIPVQHFQMLYAGHAKVALLNLECWSVVVPYLRAIVSL